MPAARLRPERGTYTHDCGEEFRRRHGQRSAAIDADVRARARSPDAYLAFMKPAAVARAPAREGRGP